MLKAALLKMVNVFSPVVLRQGMEDMQRGQVLTIRLSEGLLKARVKGAVHQLYDIHLDLKSWPSGDMRCACQDQVPCRHIAACFFSLQDQAKLNVVQLPELPINIKRAILNEDSNISIDNVLDVDTFEWYSNVDGDGHDFFSYQLGIVINGVEVDIMPLVIDLLHRMTSAEIEAFPEKKRIDLPLQDGKRLRIEFGRLRPLLRVLLHYTLGSGSGGMRNYHVSLMQEAEDALRVTTARWRGTQALRDQLQKLTAMSELPHIEPPLGLHTSLRDYQQHGLNWLHFLKSMQFGGVLADDMGLGKTIQTLALLQYEKEQGRLKTASLILAPTSLVGNWFEEARRFTPDLKILVFHGFDRHHQAFDEYDVVISTYGLIQRDKSLFIAYPFYYLILDEAQFIKNSRTKTTQIVLQIQSRYRLCLTGTPLENHLGELWSLFHFLMPGLLGNARQFRQFFRLPIEKQADKERQSLLAKRVQPFLLRRTKDEVLRELPLKTEMVRKLALYGPQRDLYEAIRLSMEAKVREVIARQGFGKSQIVVLDALLKLRQVCCDPRLLSLPQADMAFGHSAKLDALMALLDNVMDEGRAVLVFSQFTSMLALIEEKLIERKYAYLTLTGKTKDRQSVVQRFQNQEASIFLISLRAGGTGLNLTRADTVILYDPWWNPAVQDQAIARSHRIGQINPVFVYKLIAAGTVEETIVSIQDQKRGLFEGVLSEQGTAGFKLTEDELLQCFAPME